jgi:hypothetical protein
MGPPAGPDDSWAVYNGSLFMNFHPSIRQRFLAQADTLIPQGNQRWAQLWGDLQAGPFNTACLAETWQQRPCTTDPQVLPGITPGPSPSSPSPSHPHHPSPSPSPSPSAGNCAATVHKLCPGETGDECVRCCEQHAKDVRPVCPSMDDVKTACNATLRQSVPSVKGGSGSNDNEHQGVCAAKYGVC